MSRRRDDGALGSTGAGRHATHYLRRHQYAGRRISSSPSPGLGLVVVVPARAETNVVDTLDSLFACERPPVAVEVIVVLNAGREDSSVVYARNRAGAAALRQWAADRRDPAFAMHLAHHEALPSREAGVGLARKLGMDEALARLAAVDHPRGAIASLDADCLVDRDYLRAVWRHFETPTPAATVYFEHPLDPRDPARCAAVARYELFLRYYVNGMRYAGGTLAHHTLGSCFVVRADSYAAVGGMNRRRAGEDFYFLNKLAQRGPLSEVLTTRVVPSARLSERTPFGTGRALARAQSGSLAAYDPRVFESLRCAYAALPSLRGLGHAGAHEALRGLGPAGQWLAEAGLAARCLEAERHTASCAAFVKRVRAWLDGFRALKCVHWLTARHFARAPIERAAGTLLEWIGGADAGVAREASALELLASYRSLDRSGRLSPTRGG